MYDHVVALNSPRLIPSGVHRKTERDMNKSSAAGALSGSSPAGGGVGGGGVGSSSTRPYSMPSGGGGYGPGLGLSGAARGGSLEFDAGPGSAPTDSLEPHWLLELCIQACCCSCCCLLTF